jgi:plasmid maintenance system antidote protein VapI
LIRGTAGPDLWSEMQRVYDLWHAQQKLNREIKHIPTLEPHAAAIALR